MVERVRLSKSLVRVKLKSAHQRYISTQGKCSQQIIDDFCDYLMRGLPIDKCCDLIGISHQSYYNWVTWGKSYLETGEPDHYEIYGDFFQATKKAGARWQLEILDRSMNTRGFKPAWVRDMTLLERKDRSNWGRGDSGKPEGGAYDPDEKFL